MEEDNKIPDTTEDTKTEVKDSGKTFSADYVADLREESKERKAKLKEANSALEAANLEREKLAQELEALRLQVAQAEQDKKDSAIKSQLSEKVVDIDAALILLKAGDWFDEEGNIKDAFYEKYPLIAKQPQTKKIGNEVAGGKSNFTVKSIEDLKGMDAKSINEHFETLKEKFRK